MGWREAIVQEIALTAGLLLASWFELGWVSEVLTLVRLPLALVLLVALGYALWLARQRQQAPAASAQRQAEDGLLERARGA